MGDNISDKKVSVIVIMGLLTAVGPLSIDMYLPAFPAIARSLHTTVSQVTLSLSSFFIGISAGQLLYGPLLERYGRKKPLSAGLSLYIVASAGCAFASSVNALIAWRLLQAVGGCAGMVAARAMVRDLFDTRENAKVFSMLMLVVSISPIIAPTLGGYITAAFGWQSVFIALIIIVIGILVGSYCILPESRQPDSAFSLHPAFIFRSFAAILGTPSFLVYALTGAVSYAGLYAYVGGSPYVFMELFTVSEAQFGWIFSFIAMGIIGASQLNNLALKSYSSRQVIRVASGCQTLIGLLFTGFALLGWLTLMATVLFAFLFLVCQGFIFPNATALALVPVGNRAGNASALIGAMQMTVGASASAVVSLFENHSAVPMALVMMCCAAIAFAVFMLGSKLFISNEKDDDLKVHNPEAAVEL